MKKGLFAILAVLAVFAMVMTGCDTGGNPKPTQYTVTFNLNGGSGQAPAVATVNAGQSVALPKQGSMVAPSDKPYFIGWGDNTASTTALKSPYTPTKSLTLYAIWSADIPDDIDPTVPEDPGYTVPVYPAPAAGDIVEEIGLSNGWTAIFIFTLPAGRTWGDYEYMTVDHKLADVGTTVRARVFGNFVPDEVKDAKFGSYNGENFAVVGDWVGGKTGAWIWSNEYGTAKAANELFTSATPAPTNNTWFTVKYTIDGSQAHAQWDTGPTADTGSEPTLGRKPQAEYKGPFYIGVGPHNTNGDDPAVISEIKNVTLVGYEGMGNVIGMPLYFKSAGGVLYRAFNGHLEGTNTWGGKPHWEIKSGEEKIKAAALTANFVPAPLETVKITFKANYGEEDADFEDQPEDQVVTIVKGDPVTLPVLRRLGYTFLGWFVAAEGGTKVPADATYEAATTLYAQWVEFNLPNKVIVEGAGLSSLISPAWGAVVGTGDAAGYIIMASDTWNNTDHSNNNDSLINISFPAGLDSAFNMFKIYYDYKEIEAPTITTEEAAAGWVKDAGAIAKKYNSADNAGNPGSYFSFNQAGGVVERTFNANVTVTSGMSIQINKGDDATNKQRRAGLVYGIKITKLEFYYRDSVSVDGSALDALITPAWGAKVGTGDAAGYIIMAGADWNNTDHGNNNDSLLNIAFPADLDPSYDKFIITYSYKEIVAPTITTEEAAAGWVKDAGAIAKKYNTGDNGGNCIGSTGSGTAGSYFSFSQSSGSSTMYFITNANVTLTSGMSIQINKGDDASNQQRRAGLVYGIKITKLEFFIESPLAP
jgi:uncharacterized repeat protein (TIGR02543 family)